MKLSALALTTLLGLVASAPVTDSYLPDGPLSTREDKAFASLTTWSGTNCEGSSANQGVGVVAFTCFPTPGGSFSDVFGDTGCELTTWSGTNCEGSSRRFDMESAELAGLAQKLAGEGTKCNVVQFGSFSLNC